ESDRIPSPAGSSSRLAGEPRVQAQVLNDVRRAGYADVVVLLRDGLAPSSDLEAFETAADAVQDAVLSAVPSEQFEVHTKYDALPILAGRVTAAGLAALERHPLVAAVEADEVMKPIAYTHPGTSVSGRVDPGQALAEAVPVIEADYVHEHYGITGEGVTVAVLDTGIDNDHPDFADKILDQYCYASSRSCPPTDIVEGPSAEDEYGHGTAVSGIILSNGTVSHVGVAPGAKLAAVRVFKDSGGASTSDIIKGLDWVLRKQHPLGIRVVNMSLGAGASLGNNCDDQQQATKEAFGRLVARQVIIFVATGNNGLPSQVSSPACISNSTAVGATYDVESPTGGRWCPQQKDVTPLTIACFTNRGRAMDLLAPGLFIVTSGMGGGVTEPGAGTSYASPMAAGVAALMLQADPDLRPSEIERIMQRTGTDVKHLENDDIFSLVNARRAVEEVLPETPMPSETPEPSATPTREATNEPSDTPTPEPGTPATSPTAAERTPTSTRTAAPTRTRTVNDDYDLFLPALKNLAR
ncbi:MAG: S8 family peptidase, partial [Anaerolineae bacterium]